MNEDPMGSAMKALFEQLSTECIRTNIHKEHSLYDIVEFSTSINLSCLAKERCIPIIDNFILCDL
jgi:hypothetical protein